MTTLVQEFETYVATVYPQGLDDKQKRHVESAFYCASLSVLLSVSKSMREKPAGQSAVEILAMMREANELVETVVRKSPPLQEPTGFAV